MDDLNYKVFGPDSPESEAIAEARYNARMLLEDAELLFEADRWGTSISLSILACEEAGKFLLLNYNLGQLPFHEVTALRLHKPKQVEFSRYLQSLLRIQALDEYLLAIGEADPKKRRIASLIFFDKCLSLSVGSDDSANAILSDPELGPMKMAIDARAASDPAYALGDQAALGQLDSIKQQGFYVDVKEHIIWSPRYFSEKDASLYLRAARLVVDAIAPETMFQ